MYQKFKDPIRAAGYAISKGGELTASDFPAIRDYFFARGKDSAKELEAYAASAKKAANAPVKAPVAPKATPAPATVAKAPVAPAKPPVKAPEAVAPVAAPAVPVVEVVGSGKEAA